MTKTGPKKVKVTEERKALLDICRRKMPLMWRVHYMSKMMTKPVHPNVTVKFGISLVELRVILTISHLPGLLANQVIDVWALEKMAVSRAIQGLLSRKLLRRAFDSEDKRRRPLYLTSEGAEMYGKIWPGAERHYSDLMNALTPAEYEIFTVAADKLIDRATLAWEEAEQDEDESE
jgi:DNA-binding MarR family transcriptional regulator